MSNFANAQPKSMINTFPCPLKKIPLLVALTFVGSGTVYADSTPERINDQSAALKNRSINDNPAYQEFFAKKPEQSHSQCQPEPITPRPLEFFLKPSLNEPQNTTIRIQADRLQQLSSRQYRLQGDTSFQQNGLLLFSPLVHLDTEKQTLLLGMEVSETPAGGIPPRPVVLHQADAAIKAHHVTFDQLKRELQLYSAQYQLFPSLAYGTADKIQVSQDQQSVWLDNATLTTCKSEKPAGEGKQDWYIKFAELRVDDREKRVYGTNSIIRFKGVPIYYSPFFNYSYADRASGFLFPDIGRHKSVTSDTAIHYVKVPYFFNLAPNYDATLSSMPMTQRGLLLDGEFRYLLQTAPQYHQGTIQLSYLNDQLSKDCGTAIITPDGTLEYSDPKADRWRLFLDTHQNWGQGFSSELQWHEISDPSFYSDLPVDERYTDATELRQNAVLRYQTATLSSYLQFLSYEPLKTLNNLYQKRPEIGIDWLPWQAGNWQTLLHMRATDFKADNPNPDYNPIEVEGRRLHFAPMVQYQQRNLYSGLQISARLHQTQYDLDYSVGNQNEVAQGLYNRQQTDLTRSVPEFKAYANLKFERQYTDFLSLQPSNLKHSETYTQTLEPEAQYLYIPYRDQQTIPLFDTEARSLDFSNLFIANRFNGIDRIGDSHQISYALSSRIYSPSGRELLDMGIGQIAYLKDRKVTLQEDQRQTGSFSDFYAKIHLRLQKLNLENTLKTSHQLDEISAANSRLHWQISHNKSAYIQYTLNKEATQDFENFAVGGYLPLSNEIQLGLYSRYDMQTRRFEENQLAFGYHSCCWSAQMVAGRTQLENGLYNDEIRFQFELKGLSSSNGSNKLHTEIADLFNY